MNKKEQLIEIFTQARQLDIEYVAVAIETMGRNKAIEIIINPSCNSEAKLEYYIKSYDDNLVLKTFNGISIVSVCGFDKSCTMEEIEELLAERFQEDGGNVQ